MTRRIYFMDDSLGWSEDERDRWVRLEFPFFVVVSRRFEHHPQFGYVWVYEGV
jgi:hypothetical protein